MKKIILLLVGIGSTLSAFSSKKQMDRCEYFEEVTHYKVIKRTPSSGTYKKTVHTKKKRSALKK